MNAPTPDREYPLIVEITEYRVVWIEAETADEAFDRASNDGELYEWWSEPVEADWKVRRPERGDNALIRQADSGNGYITRSTEGPLNACRTCGAVAFEVHPSALYHKKECTSA